MKSRAQRTMLAVPLAVALVGVGGALAGPASGLTNTYIVVQCTTTVTTSVASLTVATGVTCVDGAAGGAVRGSITVQPGGGLYVEEASIGGSIIASRPTMVFTCSTDIGGSVIVDGATGVQQGPANLGPTGVAINNFLFCVTSPAGEVHGKVMVSNTGRGRGALPGTFASVGDPVDGTIVVAKSAYGTYLDYGHFHGRVTLQGNSGLVTTGTGEAGDIFYNGIVVQSNTGGVSIKDNLIHGPIINVNNSAPVVIGPNFSF